ncbi:MAG: response regulator [Acidobacteria bacterium]|nr:response regulator [Acidobacteriota bacterium]
MGENAGGTTTVIVAEDNFLTAHLIVATLEKAGYRAIAGRDGDEVSRLIGTHRPRVLIVNLNLSRPSGMELLRTLRKAYAELRAIAFLAPTQADLRAQAAGLGAESFFESPFDPSALVAEVERLAGE